MKRSVSAILMVCAIGISTPQSSFAQDLPPEIQFQVSSTNLKKNFDAKNYESVLLTIEALRKLDYAMPKAFLESLVYYEAVAFYHQGVGSPASTIQTVKAGLTKYLTDVGPEGEFYNESLELLGSVQSDERANEKYQKETLIAEEKDRDRRARNDRSYARDRYDTTWLGVDTYKSDGFQGLTIETVFKGSPAEKAGLKKTYRLVRIDDQWLQNTYGVQGVDIDSEDWNHFSNVVRNRNPGDKIEVYFYPDLRDSGLKVVTVTLVAP